MGIKMDRLQEHQAQLIREKNHLELELAKQAESIANLRRMNPNFFEKESDGNTSLQSASSTIRSVPQGNLLSKFLQFEATVVLFLL